MRLKRLLKDISLRRYGIINDKDLNETFLPYVFCVGNHSSGKSTFINHLLHRDVQSTGIAPTDDCFTIICPGEDDMDVEGPALIDDPDLGFTNLKTFGSNLVNHTLLKVRSDVAINDLMIVDSPGMIDCRKPSGDGSYENTGIDRGYDFEEVCRWFAVRADLILLFFDPDKPGTVSESLTILERVLSKMDQKLMIVFNKADQFSSVHDFAHAFGSLGWNISRAIPGKRLPKIYTMYLPNEASFMLHERPSSGESRAGSAFDDMSLASGRSLSFSRGFFKFIAPDLDNARKRVLKEVYCVPRRRLHTDISMLGGAATGLLMHCRLLDAAREEYCRTIWRAGRRLLFTGALYLGLYCAVDFLFDRVERKTATPSASEGKGVFGSLWASLHSSPPMEQMSPPSSTNSVLAHEMTSNSSSILGFLAQQTWILDELRKRDTWTSFVAVVGALHELVLAACEYWAVANFAQVCTSPGGSLQRAFEDIYEREISTEDQTATALGSKILRHLRKHIPFTKAIHTNAGVASEFGKSGDPDVAVLQRIVQQDLVQLRRSAFTANTANDFDSASIATLSPPGSVRGGSIRGGGSVRGGHSRRPKVPRWVSTDDTTDEESTSNFNLGPADFSEIPPQSLTSPQNMVLEFPDTPPYPHQEEKLQVVSPDLLTEPLGHVSGEMESMMERFRCGKFASLSSLQNRAGNGMGPPLAAVVLSPGGSISNATYTSRKGANIVTPRPHSPSTSSLYQMLMGKDGDAEGKAANRELDAKFLSVGGVKGSLVH